MGTQTTMLTGGRVDLSTLEADMAFFEARLSLAGSDPDTSYQRAQIKTYQTLGVLLGDTLERLKPKRRTTQSRKETAGSAV